jgi:hypothetical protein
MHDRSDAATAAAFVERVPQGLRLPVSRMKTQALDFFLRKVNDVLEVNNLHACVQNALLLVYVAAQSERDVPFVVRETLVTETDTEISAFRPFRYIDSPGLLLVGKPQYFGLKIVSYFFCYVLPAH